MEKNCIKNYNKWYFLVPFVFFCLLAYGVTNQYFAPIDKEVYTCISQYHMPILTILFKILTMMGTFGMMVFIILMIYFKNKQMAKTMLIYLVVSSLLKEGLKYLFIRPRPSMLWLVDASGYSFPSGHATLSLCFYGLCIYFLMKSTVPYKKVWSLCLVFLIVCIGLSRVYLGVHYFSDILAGYLIGCSCLLYVVNNSRLKT